jgi:hypothetical protein
MGGASSIATDLLLHLQDLYKLSVACVVHNQSDDAGGTTTTRAGNYTPSAGEVRLEQSDAGMEYI